MSSVEDRLDRLSKAAEEKFRTVSELRKKAEELAKTVQALKIEKQELGSETASRLKLAQQAHELTQLVDYAETIDNQLPLFDETLKREKAAQQENECDDVISSASLLGAQIANTQEDMGTGKGPLRKLSEQIGMALEELHSFRVVLHDAKTQGQGQGVGEQASASLQEQVDAAREERRKIQAQLEDKKREIAIISTMR
jgi:hypothetical protein